jgi:hypothetical protein
MIYLYDRIEFNDSLRYADVTKDVAHLSMDLDYNSRINLREYFVSQYIKLNVLQGMCKSEGISFSCKKRNRQRNKKKLD